MREDSPVGTTIGQVSGTDADLGSNAVIFYHIVGTGMLRLLLLLLYLDMMPVETFSTLLYNVTEFGRQVAQQVMAIIKALPL